MNIIADLHLHSKYSRATSPQMDVVNLNLWGLKKGIDLLGTGDFTHPIYLKELKHNLMENGSGFLKLKEIQKNNINFILSSEISCIYKDKGKTRRLHLCLLSPDFKSVDKIIKKLEKHKCNLKSDGRPMIGLSAKNLTEIVLESNEKNIVFPAHIWTPWYALFGSKSGYDSLEDCFEDLTPYIYAVETGLSSDPAMNWRIKDLDKLMLLSNSDAHSLRNIGREANIFNLNKLEYDYLFDILKNKDYKNFLKTLEFYPEAGMYHNDGHRDCNFSCSPVETKNKYKGVCPVCHKSLTVGVNYRVNQLADRKLNFKPKQYVSYVHIIPLEDILSDILQKNKNTKAVQVIYEKMIKLGVNEFNILLNLEQKDIEKISNKAIAQAISKVRQEKVKKISGFDGEYGKINIL